MTTPARGWHRVDGRLPHRQPEPKNPMSPSRSQRPRWGAWAPKVRLRSSAGPLQLDHEDGAPGRVVPGPDATAVLAHDPARDGQPEPGAAVGAGGVGLVEPLEDPL